MATVSLITLTGQGRGVAVEVATLIEGLDPTGIVASGIDADHGLDGLAADLGLAQIVPEFAPAENAEAAALPDPLYAPIVTTCQRILGT